MIPMVKKHSWRQSIEARGFAVVPDLFPSAHIENIRKELDAAPLRRSRAGARHVLSEPVVAQLAHDSRLLDIAQQILGPNAFPYRATLFAKSSIANWLVVWHQDTALPLRERQDIPGWGPWSVKDGVIYAHAPASALEQVLALRIHLDDSTVENGPLRVLPATHTHGVLTNEAIERLAFEIHAVDCLVSAGGVVAMRPLIVHASSKATSVAPRRVLHIEYATQPKLLDGLELAASIKLGNNLA
jgi:ectoine hydroxylase-related dioxygenase (phytanoyl-CoA dioxygenase family)